jgi:hypothetical protein
MLLRVRQLKNDRYPCTPSDDLPTGPPRSMRNALSVSVRTPQSGKFHTSLTTTVIIDHLVSCILDHVYQYYTHYIQMTLLEEFVSLGHRLERAQQEAELQQRREEVDEKKE